MLFNPLIFALFAPIFFLVYNSVKKYSRTKWFIIAFFDPIIPTEIAARYLGYGYYHKYYEKGWIESDKLPVDRDISLRLYTKEFKNNTFSGKVFDEFLKNIISLQKKGVKIFVLRMPVYNKLKKLEDSLSGFDESVIRSRLTNQGIYWISVKDSLYNTYDGDGSHLDSESSKLTII